MNNENKIVLNKKIIKENPIKPGKRIKNHSFLIILLILIILAGGAYIYWYYLR